MACEGSSYTRTAKRSLGVYDLIAAAEWRELTSRYSALEQSDRTYGQSTQASATLHLPNKQGRLCQTPWRFTETPYNFALILRLLELGQFFLRVRYVGSVRAAELKQSLLPPQISFGKFKLGGFAFCYCFLFGFD